MMTKRICMVLAIVGMAVAGCNSDRNAGSGDTLATDTNIMDTMKTDSAGMVDSAVKGSGTNTTGGTGTTTGGDGAGSSTGTNNGQGTGSGAANSSGNHAQGAGSGTGSNSGNSGQ